MSGCVDLQGNVTVILESQPDEGSTLLPIISFNCPTPLNQSNYNFEVKISYQNKSCHKLSYSQNNQPNSLSLSLDVKECGGVSKALIIGLSVGIPVTIIFIAIFSLYILRYKLKREADKFHREQNESNNDIALEKRDNFQNNQAYKNNSIDWKDFEKI